MGASLTESHSCGYTFVCSKQTIMQGMCTSFDLQCIVSDMFDHCIISDLFVHCIVSDLFLERRCIIEESLQSLSSMHSI